MTKSQRKALESLFYSLERKCESMREWRDMLETIEENERGHRTMGRRMCGAKYSQPVSVAVCFFACKCVLEPIATPQSWTAATFLRRDYVLGQSLRERAGDLTGLEIVWKDLGLDYSTDIV